MLVPQTKPNQNQIFTAPSVKYFSLQGRDNKRQFIFLKCPNAEINRGIQDKIRKSLFHKGKRAYERLTFTRLLWKVIPPTNIHPLLQEHFKNPKNLNHMNQVSVSTLHIYFPLALLGGTGLIKPESRCHSVPFLGLNFAYSWYLFDTFFPFWQRVVTL